MQTKLSNWNNSTGKKIAQKLTHWYLQLALKFEYFLIPQSNVLMSIYGESISTDPQKTTSPLQENLTVKNADQNGKLVNLHLTSR